MHLFICDNIINFKFIFIPLWKPISFVVASKTYHYHFIIWNRKHHGERSVGFWWLFSAFSFTSLGSQFHLYLNGNWIGWWLQWRSSLLPHLSSSTPSFVSSATGNGFYPSQKTEEVTPTTALSEDLSNRAKQREWEWSFNLCKKSKEKNHDDTMIMFILYILV